MGSGSGIRKFCKEIVDAVARGEVFEHGLDRVAQAADHELAVTHGRIDGDTTGLAHDPDDTRIALRATRATEGGGAGSRD